MSHDVSRRKLIASAAAIAAAPVVKAFESPTIWIPQGSAKPCVISSGNGNQFKNGGDEVCVARTFRLMSSGADPLDAIVAGVELNELDPADTSVGYGGLPNMDGIVQLDASVMHGPKKWAGSVACLEGVRTPAKVAKLVAEVTDHHLLVGKGAQDFARQMGFTIEADLNTEASRKQWLEWKRRTDPGHYLDPTKRDRIGGLDPALLSMVKDGLIDPLHVYGTINCQAVNEKGHICGCTTTSGLAFKIPGRVGDSPILGAGNYVDGAVGAGGSTGRGEANLFGLCSYLIVEEMRRGKHPKDAALEAVRRISANTIEKRLLNEQGQPNFGILFYAMDIKGRHAGVTLKGRARYAVCDDKGPRLEDCVALYE